jgi:hypothetical protein
MAGGGDGILADGEGMMEQSEKNLLLDALMNMCIEPDGAALSFAKRLARENSWTDHFAERVVTEYKRFLYLAATSQHPVTPSDEVDQAWHLHLAYSRHYWDVMCASILKRPLHHGPTSGGSTEDSRYRDQYAATLASYKSAFEAAAPEDIWPDGKRRFGAEYRRLPVGKYWILPKRAGYGLAAAFALAACSGNQVIGVTVFFTLCIGVQVILYFALRGLKNKNKNDRGCGGATGSSGCSSNDSDGGSGCSSGCGGCGGGD